jgi:hypothetical protein
MGEPILRIEIARIDAGRIPPDTEVPAEQLRATMDRRMRVQKAADAI